MSVTLTAAASTDHIHITISNSGVPTRNEVWRRTTNEYGGAYIRICSTVIEDGTFDDYNVASGITYDYFIREVTGGATVDSAAASATLTLSRVAVHVVTKRSASTNKDASYGLLSLHSPDTHEFDFAFELTTEALGGNITQNQLLGAGETNVRQVPIIVPLASTAQATRESLETMLRSNKLLCLRTPNQVKAFGVFLNGLRQTYDLSTTIPLLLTETDYSEAI